MGQHRLCLVLVLVGCSGGNQSGAGASVMIRFGDQENLVESTPVTEGTDTRLLIRLADGEVTALLSLAKPLVHGTIQIDPGSQQALVWAKQGTGVPLVADRGQLSVSMDAANVSISIEGVSKDADSYGTSLFMSGTVASVPF